MRQQWSRRMLRGSCVMAKCSGCRAFAVRAHAEHSCTESQRRSLASVYAAATGTLVLATYIRAQEHASTCTISPGSKYIMWCIWLLWPHYNGNGSHTACQRRIRKHIAEETLGYILKVYKRRWARCDCTCVWVFVRSRDRSCDTMSNARPCWLVYLCNHFVLSISVVGFHSHSSSQHVTHGLSRKRECIGLTLIHAIGLVRSSNSNIFKNSIEIIDVPNRTIRYVLIPSFSQKMAFSMRLFCALP